MSDFVDQVYAMEMFSPAQSEFVKTLNEHGFDCELDETLFYSGAKGVLITERITPAHRRLGFEPHIATAIIAPNGRVKYTSGATPLNDWT